MTTKTNERDKLGLHRTPIILAGNQITEDVEQKADINPQSMD